MALKLTDIYEKNKTIPWRLIEKEAILVDPDEGELLRLTPVATTIWEALDGERSVEGVIDYVQETFEGESKRVRREVLSFLKRLRQQGLVESKRFLEVEKGIR